MMLRIRIFMLFSLVFMILALLTGIFRLMSVNSFSTGIFVQLYPLHSIIMVFGFLSIIVMTERVSSVMETPGLNNSKIPTLMVIFMILGILGEIIGYVYYNRLIIYFGSVLLFIGCIFFIILLYLLSRKTNIKLSFWYMILSVSALSIASLLSAFYLPAGRYGFIMLLILFPILFIIGERVELSRFFASPLIISRFNHAFVLSLISVVLFSLSSFLLNIGQIMLTLGFIMLLITVLLVLSVESSNIKRLISAGLPLQKYVSFHVRLAYIWMILGIILAIIYVSALNYFVLYDSFIHSLTVGFIGTMLLAHAPIIFPTVLKKKTLIVPSFSPLTLLTLGNVIRVGGDIILIITNSNLVRFIVGFSGWLILISFLLFAKEILFKVLSS